MPIKLKPPPAPAFLKMGLFGGTGTGKTYTAARVLSQFIAGFVPDSQLAMFDTEGGAGYVAPLVKAITGKDLLVITAHAFSELLEFAELVRKKRYVALLDSATHPWRSLVADYLDVKKSRVKGAGGNEEKVRLSLKDWGPIKEHWAKFSDKLRYDPVHWCICGREGDVWAEVEDEEGEKELRKTGVKMKTEIETGYEPSMLVRMTLDKGKHIATVVKDRFDRLTGCSMAEPDIEFFRPHLELLDLGGKQARPSEKAEKTFAAGSGPNWETIQARREALLEDIKDDITLAYPGRDDASKKTRIELLRDVFNTSSWTKLQKDHNQYPVETLEEGRAKLRAILSKKKE